MNAQSTLPILDPDVKARCYARILQALHHLLPPSPDGVSYEQIQKWIEQNLGFYMTAVNQRCLEMSKLSDAFIMIVHDGRGRAYVKYKEEETKC